MAVDQIKKTPNEIIIVVADFERRLSQGGDDNVILIGTPVVNVEHGNNDAASLPAVSGEIETGGKKISIKIGVGGSIGDTFKILIRCAASDEQILEVQRFVLIAGVF